LGGEVVLDRVEDLIVIGGPDWASMLSEDIKLEEIAIEVYTKQLDMVKDDSVKRLLERVIRDENHHRIEVIELKEKVMESIVSMQEEPKKADPKVIEVLNKFLQEEYQSIINHLYQFFHSRDINHRDTMLDIAIESMVHMGKLGEAIGELGGMPDIRADLGRKDRKTMQESLAQDIKFEQETGGDYKKALGQIEDEGLKKLFELIANQEEYHKHMLMEVLKKMRRLTVGDLRRKE